MPFKEIRKCKFNPAWKNDPAFSTWLQDVIGDVYSAYCTGCKKKIDLGNMGIGALKSHCKGKTHLLRNKNSTSSNKLENFFPSNDKPVSSAPSISQVNQMTLPSTSEDVIKAEVLWVLNVVMKGHSFNSNENVSQLFKKMFPDSSIAEDFSCGPTKCAYIICFGLYPYYHELLLEYIRSAKYYTISFDESLNEITQ